jgi:hypothetical protein
MERQEESAAGAPRKLQMKDLKVKRETLRVLTDTEADQVAGGMLPTGFSYVRSSYPMYCCRDTQHTTGGD